MSQATVIAGGRNGRHIMPIPLAAAPPPGSRRRSPPWPWRLPSCSARPSPWPPPGAAPPPRRRRSSANVPVPGLTGRPEMILQDAFTVEPWNLRETHLDLDLLAQTESVFALANGHVGWRANLDEGEPHALPGSYLNGGYESRPLPYADQAYGLPETGQENINVTNGKLNRLEVNDEPFEGRPGQL